MDCWVKCGLLLFLMVCLPFWSDGLEEDDAWALSTEEEAEIEKQLKMLNKPSVKAFKDANGDIYDCVDMYKQPAFDHPLLKNHSSRIRSSLQARKANATSTKETLLGFGFEEQCPSGTVLIRRSTKEDLVRAKKYPHYLHPADNTNAAADNTYVAVVVCNTTTKKYYGAAARMEVFHLRDILPNQITAAQVNLIKGQKGPRNYLNTIQFGWHVNYQLYGNYDTHFFTYRTTNGYQNGCYNGCGFFVQVSRTITPGMILSNNVTALTLSVNRVNSNGDWLLRYREHDDDVYEDVGFWPKEAFTNMADVTMVLMGGIVFSPADEPSPPMGNGIQPENARGARFTHVSLRDGDGNFYDPDKSEVTTFRSVAEYWVGKNGNQGDDKYMFEYGGPGGYKV